MKILQSDIKSEQKLITILLEVILPIIIHKLNLFTIIYKVKQQYKSFHSNQSLTILSYNIMTWRQAQTSPKATTAYQQSLTQITQIRTQNIRLKIQLQQLSRQIQPLKSQIQKLHQIQQQYIEKQNKIVGYLTRISIILGIGYTDKYRNKQKQKSIMKQKNKDGKDKDNEMLDLIEQIQKKVLDQKQKYRKLQKQFQKATVNAQIEILTNLQSALQIQKVKNKQYQQTLIESNQKINILSSQNTRLRHQLQQKTKLLSQLSHKIANVQLQYRNNQIQLKQLRSSNINFHGQQYKKQCLQLLSQINVRDDDYLKSYLLKNQKFQNGANGGNTILRKNKYDFIFQQ